MEPDLELVQVRYDQSFKIWSHGYPFRTVRWHIGPFSAGDLVFVGPNLPHNWISDMSEGDPVEERCLVLQFTNEFITASMATFPELRFIQQLLRDSMRASDSRHRYPSA